MWLLCLLEYFSGWQLYIQVETTFKLTVIFVLCAQNKRTVVGNAANWSNYCKVKAVEKGIAVCVPLHRCLLFGTHLQIFYTNVCDKLGTSVQQELFLVNQIYNLVVKLQVDCRLVRLYFQIIFLHYRLIKRKQKRRLDYILMSSRYYLSAVVTLTDYFEGEHQFCGGLFESKQNSTDLSCV